ncbi:ficolin-1-like [Physella acuta]|uniref:ficolin-1-like n=1 Tax=Physella acuta TaxID=109671 RepID=UPI0027DDC035|nr:ficolin-1-like [Physella acuta]
MTFGNLKIIFATLLLFCPVYTQANCKCEQITTYENGHRVCSCRPGYAVSRDNPNKCQDIDECGNNSTSPCEQICSNTIGSYSCSCNSGYSINSTDASRCEDIDECGNNSTSPCEQICSNTIGSYSCSCNSGYNINSTDASRCEDIDECGNNSTSPCEQICSNTIGSYSCSCKPGYSINSTDASRCEATCKSVNNSDPRPLVNLDSGVEVMCDTETDGGGWIIFQRRVSGSVDFYRNWTEYKNGFGDFSSGNFYLGNENIYLLTSNRPTELRVDFIHEGTKYFAQYSSFNISSESDGYRLHVGGYTGDYADNLAYHNDMKFSTFDQDNDMIGLNCAEMYQGAWWYKTCYYSNLNGVYGSQEYIGICWLDFVGLSLSEMKFRRA